MSGKTPKQLRRFRPRLLETTMLQSDALVPTDMGHGHEDVGRSVSTSLAAQQKPQWWQTLSHYAKRAARTQNSG